MRESFSMVEASLPSLPPRKQYNSKKTSTCGWCGTLWRGSRKSRIIQNLTTYTYNITSSYLRNCENILCWFDSSHKRYPTYNRAHISLEHKNEKWERDSSCWTPILIHTWPKFPLMLLFSTVPSFSSRLYDFAGCCVCIIRLLGFSFTPFESQMGATKKLWSEGKEEKYLKIFE